MNSKGIFITLSIFFLGILLLSSATNLTIARDITFDSSNIFLAGQRAGFIKEQFVEVLTEVYITGAIDWEKNDNNFVYVEEFPNLIAKETMQNNFLILKQFFLQEYPNNIFNPESNDMSRIFVIGKDFNVGHSVNGFSDNTQVNFSISEVNFDLIQFEMDVNSSIVTVVSDGLKECTNNCSTPLHLIIIIRDNLGQIVYSYDDIINYSQNQSARFSTTSTGNDLTFDYDKQNQLFSWTKTDDPATLTTTVSFLDSDFEISLNKDALIINEMLEFGLTG